MRREKFNRVFFCVKEKRKEERKKEEGRYTYDGGNFEGYFGILLISFNVKTMYKNRDSW